MQMRQSKREIKDEQEIRQILDACDSCRVGFCDGDQPYIVPMNFGYRWDQDGLVLYFHCAKEGRKLDILAHHDKVCVELDHQHVLITGEKACQYSMNYESLIIFGRMTIVLDPEERFLGLNSLMQHFTDRATWAFDEKALALTTVLRVTAENWSGKRLNK